MSFVLQVDAQRWRDHQRSVVDAVTRASGTAPVPVIKGNGYGFGPAVLGAEAMRWEADTIAVGTVFEVDDVAGRNTRGHRRSRAFPTVWIRWLPMPGGGSVRSCTPVG